MYKIEGKVIRGLGNGRKVSMPTANLDIKDLNKEVEYGVYACYVYVLNKRYMGVCNIGNRPTVDNALTIEVNIIDFNMDIYDYTITIELIKKIRGICKFNSLDEVKKQVDKDILYTRGLLK